MFCKNIATMFGDYYSSGPVAENFANEKPARWDTYVDISGTEHIQVGGLYWDEAQIKVQDKRDYTQHFILNAYQGISEQEKERFKKDGYQLPNLLAVGDRTAGGQGMLAEFICFAENLQNYGGFRPEIILMNFYGLQNWPNAHFHLYAGARQNQFWTVLDELVKVKDDIWFRLYGNLTYTRIAGTRNNDKVREHVLAINITDAVKADGVWDYVKLRQTIEDLTAEFQSGLTPEQRRAPAASGFGGYGSLVFLPDEEQAAGQAYYIIAEIP